MSEWPTWWNWELELSQHLLKRMIDRRFNEVDLRKMLEDATGYEANLEPDRWTIETLHADQPWHIIVEPIPSESVLLVITAYSVD